MFIYSHRRFEDLFCFGGLSGGSFYSDRLKYLCCAKANLSRGGRNIIGYVMDEENNMLQVKLDGQERLVNVRRPEYDYERGGFRYEEAEGLKANHYSLTELWPIRLKLNTSGQTNYIISTHSCVVDDDNDNNPD